MKCSLKAQIVFHDLREGRNPQREPVLSGGHQGLPPMAMTAANLCPPLPVQRGLLLADGGARSHAHSDLISCSVVLSVRIFLQVCRDTVELKPQEVFFSITEIL